MRSLIAFLLMAFAAMPAAAQTRYTFSYTFTSGGVVSGSFFGTLQGDSNTIAVEAIDGDLLWNGAPDLFTAQVDSNSNQFASSGLPATVTLDGSFMDVVFCEASCGNRLVLATNEPFGGSSFVQYVSDMVSDGDIFTAGAWSIQAVPEPAAWALMLGGFALAGGTMRRRRRALAPA